MTSIPLEPGQEFGPYTIVRQLGRGGMGTVWLARQHSLDREVALKVMAPHLQADPGFVARFRREALAAARLSHPHIVSVFDAGEIDGILYICLEFVAGEPLSQTLTRERPLDPSRVARWGEELAGALGYAHEAGVLHRDVKPANVLIDGAGHARLMDFGLAKTVDGTTITQTGVFGTPLYMAPELAEGAQASPRTDQYSLGILLYELLVGHAPYRGDSPVAILYQHAQGNAVPLREARSDVPPNLERIVSRMMATRPEDRFADCREAARALDGVRAGDSALGSESVTLVERRVRGVGLGRSALPVAAAALGIAAFAVVGLFLTGGPSSDNTGRPDEAPVLAATNPPAADDDRMDSAAEPEKAEPVGRRELAKLPAPWPVGGAGLKHHPLGGFVETFDGSEINLQPVLVRGSPTVERESGRLYVESSGRDVWIAVSPEPMRLGTCEVVFERPYLGDGAAGLAIRSAPTGRQYGVLVSRDQLLLARGKGQGEMEHLDVIALPKTVIDAEVVHIRVATGWRGLRVLVNEELVHSGDALPDEEVHPGLVVRGEAEVFFERLGVRTPRGLDRWSS